jgi:hypothetical protein
MPSRSLRLALRSAAIIGLMLAFGAACSGDDGPTTESRTATLRVLEGQVDVSGAAGVDGQVLTVGDVVHTATGGRAAIEWFDGSVTRLDENTEFTLAVIEQLPGGGLVGESEQTSGSTFHRVTDLTEAGSRFDVVTPTASASVQGTVFAVIFNDDGSILFAVLEGTVLVGDVPVPAGFMVVVADDGTVGELLPIPDELLESDWILFNQCELDAVVDCEVATLDHIVLSPADASIAAGESQAYTVEAFDTEGVSLGDVTAAATIDGAGCSGAVCSPTSAGDHEITAEYEGLSASATLTVVAGEVTGSLQVTPESANSPAGVPQNFTAQGFDAHGNSVGNVDAQFTIAGGSCEGSSCSSNAAGDHLVTATFEGATGTATLTVNPGSLSYIVVSPSTAVVEPGVSQAYTTRGYDSFGNLRGTVPATLEIVDGGCQTGFCVATTVGDHLVTAHHAGRSDTAVLTVVPGPAALIELEYVGPAPFEEIVLTDGLLGVGDAFGGLIIGCDPEIFRATITDSYGNTIESDSESVVFFGDTDGGTQTNIGFYFESDFATAEFGVAEIVIFGDQDGPVSLQAWVGETLFSNVLAFGVSGGCGSVD